MLFKIEISICILLHPPAEVNEVKQDDLAEAIDHQLDSTTDEAILRASHDARTEEDEAILEIAERQSTPADKYQHYAAATGIKLMRDSVKNLRPAKTVRELSELFSNGNSFPVCFIHSQRTLLERIFRFVRHSKGSYCVNLLWR